MTKQWLPGRWRPAVFLTGALLMLFGSACSGAAPASPAAATAPVTATTAAMHLAQAQETASHLATPVDAPVTNPEPAGSTAGSGVTAVPFHDLATPTSSPSPTVTPNPTIPTPEPPPTFTLGQLNGIPIADIITMPPEVREHVREIYASGQEQGRDAHAFSRLGASIVATQHFLGRFDYGPYDLGPFRYLQPAIDQYTGSFERVGLAAMRGLTSVAVFSPTWANHEECLPNESVIDCELRHHNPSVVIVVLGTNDKWDADEFDQNLRALVELLIERGIIPVLATKADRFEGPENTNNLLIRQAAADYLVPLWDFDLLAETLPSRGVGEDGVHLVIFDYYDYNMPEAYEYGYGMYNLSALMMLEAIRQETVRVEN